MISAELSSTSDHLTEHIASLRQELAFIELAFAHEESSCRPDMVHAKLREHRRKCEELRKHIRHLEFAAYACRTFITAPMSFDQYGNRAARVQKTPEDKMQHCYTAGYAAGFRDHCALVDEVRRCWTWALTIVQPGVTLSKCVDSARAMLMLRSNDLRELVRYPED